MISYEFLKIQIQFHELPILYFRNTTHRMRNVCCWSLEGIHIPLRFWVLEKSNKWGASEEYISWAMFLALELVERGTESHWRCDLKGFEVLWSKDKLFQGCLGGPGSWAHGCPSHRQRNCSICWLWAVLGRPFSPLVLAAFKGNSNLGMKSFLSWTWLGT